MSSPGMSFYILFCLIAIETMLSCSAFFQEHQQQMGNSAGRAMGILEKDNNNRNNDDHEDYNRQL